MSQHRPAHEIRPASAGRPTLEIHRSPRRRRSAVARAQGTALVLRLPAGMELTEEELMIERLVAKATGQQRAEQMGGDAALATRAARLADRYLDGVRPSEIVWSGRMEQRLGSCSLGSGRIRISRRLAAMPRYVLDYILVHELAHLLVPDHSPSFHSLVARYPQTERAKGFLDGHQAGQLAVGVADPQGGFDGDASADRRVTRDPAAAGTHGGYDGRSSPSSSSSPSPPSPASSPSPAS